MLSVSPSSASQSEALAGWKQRRPCSLVDLKPPNPVTLSLGTRQRESAVETVLYRDLRFRYSAPDERTDTVETRRSGPNIPHLEYQTPDESL